MPLSKFYTSNGEKRQYLEFKCTVDVIHIEYNDGCNLPNIICPMPTMSIGQTDLFIWRFGRRSLENLRHAHVDKLVSSKAFCNDCFFFMLRPNGSALDDSQGQFSVALRLLKLPFDIESVEVEYTLESSEVASAASFKEKEEFVMNSNWKYTHLKVMKTTDLMDLSSLSFTVFLKIINIKKRINF